MGPELRSANSVTFRTTGRTIARYNGSQGFCLSAMWGALLAVIVASGSPAILMTSPHVRATSSVVRSMLSEAAVSPTMAMLLRRLDASDQVVYVVFTNSPEIPTARTKLVTSSGAVRFLRIDINARIAPGDRLPLLAHELQHAVELADAPDVRDDEGVRQLYRRIGSARDQDHFETEAARRIERAVRMEIGRVHSLMARK